jgi:5-methylcytosine-specific restriction endonuclease McrA
VSPLEYPKRSGREGRGVNNLGFLPPGRASHTRTSIRGNVQALTPRRRPELSRPKPVPISPELRRQVERRDKVCVYCGDAYGPYEIDHIIPRWRHGKTELANLALACVRCNQLKAGKSVLTFLSMMQRMRDREVYVPHGKRWYRKVRA